MQSMPSAETEFDQIQEALARGGVAAALEQLAEYLRENKRYHELFEALKMKARYELGLPLTYQDAGDELDESTRTKLEDGLISACRDVGMALLREGAIREGWMYLRPVGDRAAAAVELARIEADESNRDALIEVALHEGVDPKRGFALVLEHHGTCNAITTYESVVMRQNTAAQQAAAGLLVEHVHRELLASVRSDIARQQGSEPNETTLKDLVADRDWLFGEHSYHLDTTHLASTVRFARLLEDEAQLRLALDLTAYGRRLSAQFQYKGDPPFEAIYPAHAFYFGALLGEDDLDAAVEYFRERAATLDPREHGGLPVEAYVQLLDRLGRYEPAIEALLDFVQKQPEAASQAVPLMLELSQKGGNFDKLVDYCRQRGDVLGYATAALCSAAAHK
jgi:tetratricopeptide (TPR) repeat protein